MKTCKSCLHRNKDGVCSLLKRFIEPNDPICVFWEKKSTEKKGGREKPEDSNQ